MASRAAKHVPKIITSTSPVTARRSVCPGSAYDLLVQRRRLVRDHRHTERAANRHSARDIAPACTRRQAARRVFTERTGQALRYPSGSSTGRRMDGSR